MLSQPKPYTCFGCTVHQRGVHENAVYNGRGSTVYTGLTLCIYRFSVPGNCYRYGNISYRRCKLRGQLSPTLLLMSAEELSMPCTPLLTAHAGKMLSSVPFNRLCCDVPLVPPGPHDLRHDTISTPSKCNWNIFLVRRTYGVRALKILNLQR